MVARFVPRLFLHIREESVAVSISDGHYRGIRDFGPPQIRAFVGFLTNI